MIEQAMYFALGGLCAGLLGLMILPALWRRAVRLSTRRLEMQVPLSMDEVLAERDLLRAEFAVLQHRLETQLAHERDWRAQERGELGRRTADLLSREESLATLRAELADREETLTRAQEQSVETQAQLGAAMLAVDDLSQLRERLALAEAQVQRVSRDIADRDAQLAELRARLAHAQDTRTVETAASA